MQGYNLTVTNVKLIPAYTDCGRSLSPTFDLQNTSDTAAQNNLADDSQKLKIKVEPDTSESCCANTEAAVTKPWSHDAADESPRVTISSQSGFTPAIREQNEEAIRTRCRSQREPTSLTQTSPVHRRPAMPQLYSQSIITEASSTSQATTNQSRALIQPLSNPPRYMHNSHKLGWIQRQKEMKKILKQRTQEWKEKQSLYQLMRNAAVPQNSLAANRKRGKDPMLYDAQDRGNHPAGTDVRPQTAFNWYPGYVSPNDHQHIRTYPGPRYAVIPEYGSKFAQSANPSSPFKRRHSSEASSSDVEKSGGAGHIMGSTHHEPIIKEVVSLANATSSNTDEELNTGEHGRSKRVRKSTDERNCLDRRESLDSETDNESSNTGKYISDFAEAFQNTPSDHQVAHINGLLSLPSSRETRYGITYGELKRRCGAPEYLTRVDLVAYVRHSKSSGRGLLDKYKIVSENRASRPNVMSKMCENEARVFADGILRMNMEYFPGKVLAEIATERLKKGLQKEPEDEEQQEKLKGDIKAKMKHIETTRSMLKEAFDLLQSEKDIEVMNRFELASHTFGTVNLKNHLTLFDRFFQEYQTSLRTCLEGRDFENNE